MKLKKFSFEYGNYNFNIYKYQNIIISNADNCYHINNNKIKISQFFQQQNDITQIIIITNIAYNILLFHLFELTSIFL